MTTSHGETKPMRLPPVIRILAEYYGLDLRRRSFH